jgi:Arc/MetJ family transcription regulator
MRVRIDINDELLKQAAETSGIEDPNKLVEAALRALVAREAGRRLADMSGSQPDLKDVLRRRSKPPKTRQV